MLSSRQVQRGTDSRAWFVRTPNRRLPRRYGLRQSRDAARDWAASPPLPDQGRRVATDVPNWSPASGVPVMPSLPWLHTSLPGTAQTPGGAVDHVDRTVVGRRLVLERHPDRQVRLAAVPEVAGSQAVPEEVARLRCPGDALTALAPHLVTGRAQASGDGAVDHVDRAVVGRGLVLERHPDRQVGLAAVPEVSRGQAVPELVARLRRPGDALTALAPHLVARHAPGLRCGAVDHVHRAVVGRRLVLERHPDRQVGLAAVPEVARGQAVPELVARLGSAGDALAALAPHLVARHRQAPGGRRRSRSPRRRWSPPGPRTAPRSPGRPGCCSRSCPPPGCTRTGRPPRECR